MPGHPPPFRLHLLTCTNSTCVDQGALEVWKVMRDEVRRRGLQGEIRFTKAHCLAMCGLGPNLVVYPGNYWYRRLKPSDARRIVEEHIVGGRPCEDLLHEWKTPSSAGT